MGHFTISLPNNRIGDVKWGMITKRTSLLNLIRKKLNNETKKGYIVSIEPTSPGPKEYRLLKMNEGQWTSESAGGFQVTPDDEVSASIKTAIDSYESVH